jgi:hypothetical protein
LTSERDICRFVEKDFLYTMAYMLSNYVAHSFELDFGLVLRDFDFDMTKPTFRDVIIAIPLIAISIPIPSIEIAREITIPAIPY